MYKLVVAYEGTDFNGWQIQPNAPSVTQSMQDAFFLHFGRKIKITGASRTDAGVHAIGQVAACSIDLPIEPAKLISAWNDALPPTIVIRSLEPVNVDFHPIYTVAQKTYWYHFFTQRPLPFVQRYGWFLPQPIDLEKLNDALQVFVGTHDFRSFCTGTDMGENTVRHIDALFVHYMEPYGAWRIVCKGPGFLRHMIRRIVGASIQIASKKDIDIAYLKKVLSEKDPRQTVINAPAQGLCLYNIEYKSN